MHYQKRFDKIIDECFEPGEDVHYIKVKDIYLNRHGSRFLPHSHKISLMLKASDKLDKVRFDGNITIYRRKQA